VKKVVEAAVVPVPTVAHQQAQIVVNLANTAAAVVVAAFEVVIGNAAVTTTTIGECSKLPRRPITNRDNDW